MKSKALIASIIIATSLLLIQSTIFLHKRADYNKVVEDYHQSIANYSQIHIDKALKSLYEYKDNRQRDLLYKVGFEFESASEFIQLYSIYYEYTDQGITGLNIVPSEFFYAFQRVAEKWAQALESNNRDEIPSKNGLETYIADVEEIAKVFGTYGNSKKEIKELSYKELDDILLELADKISNEDVRRELGHPFID